MIDRLRLNFALPLLLRVLGCSRSGYYAWKNRKPSKRQQEDARLALEVRAAHVRTRQTCGPRRLQQDLVTHGVKVSVHRVRRLRKELGLRCRQTRKFKITTDSNHKLAVVGNLLQQNFQATAPSQVWLSDITYIPTDEGWLYLAAHKDMFSREIVGYAMSSRITKQLVLESLFRAVVAKRPPKGLINHSDRGSQYCCGEYQGMLAQFSMLPSMSRRGNCYDNAPMESFWATLKTELVFHRRYATRKEAEQDITEYIELFYNRMRTQEKLGYLSPVAFVREFYRKQLAA